MSVTRIPIDGLWRCLCPAIDSLASISTKAICSRRVKLRSFHTPRSFHTTTRCTDLPDATLAVPTWGKKGTSVPLRIPQRITHQDKPYAVPEGAATKDELLEDGESRRPHARDYTWDSAEEAWSGGSQAQPVIRDSRYKKWIGVHKIPAYELDKLFRVEESLQSAQDGTWDTILRAPVQSVHITSLHFRLGNLLDVAGAYGLITGLVTYLIGHLGEKPSILHYEAMIRANADAEYGSVDAVRQLMAEMETSQILMDSACCHAVLQVLAIHPDYALRAEVLEEMKRRWFGLSPTGWHNVVVGLLRDRQYEAAMDRLDQMHIDGIEVQPWLYDIFLFQLCELGEHDEAFRVLQSRSKHSGHIMAGFMWYHLLDEFSSVYHYAGTKQIWELRVKSYKLNPPDGICTNILNLAARYADPDLATTCIRILSKRNAYLSVCHYEAVLEAYVGANDITTAFRMLKIMSKAGIEPEPGTTRAIYVYLTRDKETALSGIQVLEDLKQRGHALPVAAINVVIEALVKTSQHEAAANLYEQLHKLCLTGPNTETFNILLRSVNRTSASKGRAMFLASEIRALKVQPDQVTYDRLIILCLHPREEDLEDAFRYLHEMILVGRERTDRDGGKGWWMRPGTAALMVMRCVEHGDERCWAVLDEMQVRWGGWEQFRELAATNWTKVKQGQASGNVEVEELVDWGRWDGRERQKTFAKMFEPSTVRTIGAAMEESLNRRIDAREREAMLQRVEWDEARERREQTGQGKGKGTGPAGASNDG